MKLFITGTDTGVGKTYITSGLLQVFNQAGYTTLGIKPVASGCGLENGTLYNEDALLLQKHSSIQLSYAYINPFAFTLPIAPHIAAQKVNVKLSVKLLLSKIKKALDQAADVTIIEGVGGWLVPLNAHETMADFVQALNINVIMVVGLRLGCINHSLLTYAAMQACGINIIGWVGNIIDPTMLMLEENIVSLKERLAIPCFGIINYNQPVCSVLSQQIITKAASSCPPG